MSPDAPHWSILGQVCVSVHATTGGGRKESEPVRSDTCKVECLGFSFCWPKFLESFRIFPVSRAYDFTLLHMLVLGHNNGSAQGFSIGRLVFVYIRRRPPGQRL